MKRIMLLGSGELGKEFVISAKRMGHYVIAVDNYQFAPAMQVADVYHVTNMLDAHSLRKAINLYRPDIIVPEIEAIRTEVLKEFEDAGIQVVPSARAVNATMNRDTIRNIAAGLGIRTAKFNYAESVDEIVKVASGIGYPVVVKPVMSSSGKGQSVVENASEIISAWDYAIENSRGDREKVIVEEFIKFENEITLLTIKQKNGETIFCNPIGHVQERGDYQYSWQASDTPFYFKDSSSLITYDKFVRAQEIAKQITDELGGAGLFGVEFFVTKDEIIFSELSPRPHDTGMVTMISQDLSEFDLHLRAILGLPIPKITYYGGASAVVLGTDGGKVTKYEGFENALSIPGTQVRIFGKDDSRKYRRMGVVLSHNLNDAIKAASLIKVITK
ncbi:MAG: formate-dependent phosphoribosylglycinamide formyltransferase [bacterium]